MNPHNYLTDYTIDDTYYNADGIPTLFTALDNYASAHSWFHYHIRAIPDSNPSVSHFAVITYTDGNRPNLYTFNFKKI